MNGKNQPQNSWRNSSATRAKFTMRAAQATSGETDPEKAAQAVHAARSKSGILRSSGSAQIRRRKKSISNVIRALRKFCNADTAQRGRSMPLLRQWRGPLVLKPICLVYLIERNVLLTRSSCGQDSLTPARLWSGSLGKILFDRSGTRFCPFGLLRWRNSGVTALKYGNTNGGFVTTPQAQSSVLRRMARRNIGYRGQLERGNLCVVQGEDALEHRLEAWTRTKLDVARAWRMM